jgi:protein transport protein SEC23
MLGLSVKNDPRGTVSSETIKRFLLPVSDCEFALNSILDDLHPDPWTVPADERPQRATGCALNVAVSVLDSCPF